MPTESVTEDNDLSLTSLFQTALTVIAEALKSNDQRVRLQAARIVMDQCRRQNLTPDDQPGPITIVYDSPPITPPVQGRGVRPSSSQPPWYDRTN